MVVMIVGDQNVMDLSHIQPAEGAVMEGIHRQIDGEPPVKHRLGACSDIFAARLSGVAADATVAKNLGKSISRACSVVFDLHCYDYPFLPTCFCDGFVFSK